MSGGYTVIVTDTSPLITLAVADQLDVLLAPGLPVRIPDVVYLEATRVRTAAGATRLIEWFSDHIDQVQLIPTEIGVDQQRRLEEGRSIRNLGEQAALEVLDRYLQANPDRLAVLLFEDSDLGRRRFVLDRRIGVMSTGEYLRVLEAAGLIQSADFVLEEAARAGRNVERQRGETVANEAVEALTSQLRARGRGAD